MKFEKREGIVAIWKHFHEMSSVGHSISKVKIKEEYNIEEYHGRMSPVDLDIHNSIDPGWQDDFVNTISNSPSPIQNDTEILDDDDLHFFKSIIPDLKHLSREKKVLLRLKILQLVQDECYIKENNQ